MHEPCVVLYCASSCTCSCRCCSPHALGERRVESSILRPSHRGSRDLVVRSSGSSSTLATCRDSCAELRSRESEQRQDDSSTRQDTVVRLGEAKETRRNYLRETLQQRTFLETTGRFQTHPVSTPQAAISSFRSRVTATSRARAMRAYVRIRRSAIRARCAHDARFEMQKTLSLCLRESFAARIVCLSTSSTIRYPNAVVNNLSCDDALRLPSLRGAFLSDEESRRGAVWALAGALSIRWRTAVDVVP